MWRKAGNIFHCCNNNFEDEITNYTEVSFLTTMKVNNCEKSTNDSTVKMFSQVCPFRWLVHFRSVLRISFHKCLFTDSVSILKARILLQLFKTSLELFMPAFCQTQSTNAYLHCHHPNSRSSKCWKKPDDAALQWIHADTFWEALELQSWQQAARSQWVSLFLAQKCVNDVTLRIVKDPEEFNLEFSPSFNVL